MFSKLVRFLNTPVKNLFKDTNKFYGEYYKIINPDLRFIKVSGVYTLVYYCPGDRKATMFRTKSKEEASAFLTYAYSLKSKGLKAQIVFECYI